MKKGKINKNQVIRIIILLIVIIIGIVICISLLNLKQDINNNVTGNDTNEEKESYVEEIENGIKINKSNKLNEAKSVDGLLITNIQLTTKDGMTTLLADVSNNSAQKSNLKMIEIILLDKDGKELTRVNGIIDELEVNEKTQLNIAMTSDYIEAYDFKVEVK